MTQPTKSPIPSKVNYPEVVDQTGVNLFAFDGEGVSYKDNPNKSYSWKPFKLKITADQNPDPGNVINDQAHYLQVGAILFVMYNFEKSDGGSDGSGDYIFSMPPGFKVDTDIVPVVPSASFNSPFALLGDCRAYSYTDVVGYGFVYPCNETGLVLRLLEGTTGSYKNVSSGDYSLSRKDVRYAFFAQIPVKV